MSSSVSFDKLLFSLSARMVMSKRNPWIFIPTLYFAEGLPYTIVMMISTVYLKSLGASAVLIGWTSLLAWPWTLKFVWAPLVDFYGKKKDWVVIAQFILSILTGVLAVTTLTQWPIETAMVVLAVAALASATNDVAIDALYLEALPKSQQALFVGVRNTAYRLSWLFGSGAMVFLAGSLEKSMGLKMGWLTAFAILSVVMFVLTAFHKIYLPSTSQMAEAVIETPEVAIAAVNGRGTSSAGSLTSTTDNSRIAPPPVDPGSALPLGEHPENLSFLQKYGHAIISYFHQPGAIAIVAYILLFRLGDALMLKQASPFLLDPPAKGGMGLSVQDVGIVYGTVGVAFLLLGGIVGGWLISKGGVKRWLWPTAIFQNAAILLYWLLALWHPSMQWVYVVNSIEQFAYGLGCAAYTVFMLGTVKQEFKAAHYAVATGMMAMGVMLPGIASGYVLESLGYANFFLLSFFAAIPGIIAIFFLPIWKKDASLEPA